MLCSCILLTSLFSTIIANEQRNVTIIADTRTSPLEKYYGYYDVTLLHFKVPEDVAFISYKFQAEEQDLSIYGCEAKDINLYIKEGAPPVINPDGSKFPDHFLNINKSQMHYLEFKSDKSINYVNITSPCHGSHFIAAFIAYSDPRDEGIIQRGLGPNCRTFLNAALYATISNMVEIITTNEIVMGNTETLYKFYVPSFVDHAVIAIHKVTFCENCTALKVQVQALIVPSETNALKVDVLKRNNYEQQPFFIRFAAQNSNWHYVTFHFLDSADKVIRVSASSFTFNVSYFSFFPITDVEHSKHWEYTLNSIESPKKEEVSVKSNESDLYKGSVQKYHIGRTIGQSLIYNQYDLMRYGRTESFRYSFDLPPDETGATPLAINLTSSSTSMLKFVLNPAIDSGGTLQMVLAFKPNVKIVGKSLTMIKEPENHVIVACVRNKVQEYPTWPHHCRYKEEVNTSPLILNKSITNATIYIPFPEANVWYVSLKLFCGHCEPCDCPNTCQKQYTNCTSKCSQTELDSVDYDTCVENCDASFMSNIECTNCNCDGPCRVSTTNCSSSVMFDISSYPCVSGKCGSNGRCIFMVSEGFAYTSCLCENNYRGWDCSDDSLANSYAMIVLELLLLVLSNLMFLPSVYIACKREYYVEALVYFSTCFYSTFYHACDSGENIVSYCLVKLDVLQFSDFFCGLLSIWVTLIAMAHLPPNWPPILQILGAVLLAFGTTIDKTSLWVFAVPCIFGLVLVIISWIIRLKKTRSWFPNKRYVTVVLPFGMIVVLSGLILYSLFQTTSNYKYVHSLWHILMAIGIIILLPTRKIVVPNHVEPQCFDSDL